MESAIACFVKQYRLSGATTGYFSKNTQILRIHLSQFLRIVSSTSCVHEASLSSIWSRDMVIHRDIQLWRPCCDCQFYSRAQKCCFPWRAKMENYYELDTQEATNNSERWISKQQRLWNQRAFSLQIQTDTINYPVMMALQGRGSHTLQVVTP